MAMTPQRNNDLRVLLQAQRDNEGILNALSADIGRIVKHALPEEARLTRLVHLRDRYSEVLERINRDIADLMLEINEGRE